jgi:hypothetical protein
LQGVASSDQEAPALWNLPARGDAILKDQIELVGAPVATHAGKFCTLSDATGRSGLRGDDATVAVMPQSLKVAGLVFRPQGIATAQVRTMKREQRLQSRPAFREQGQLSANRVLVVNIAAPISAGLFAFEQNYRRAHRRTRGGDIGAKPTPRHTNFRTSQLPARGFRPRQGKLLQPSMLAGFHPRTLE